MRLENIVMQARDVRASGRFWTEALGLEVPTHSADIFEGRLQLAAGVWLDVCIERVSSPPEAQPRLHLDLLGGIGLDSTVQRLLALGASHLDIGQREVPWVVLADPDGFPFCVMPDRPAYSDTGPIAALPLDSADPESDAAFWSAMTGWVRDDRAGFVMLRHPSRRGPLLELCPEPMAKAGKNRVHLDVRPTPGGPDQAALVEAALELGATRVEDSWAAGHPWVVLRDPSGNELCVLADLADAAGS